MGSEPEITLVINHNSTFVKGKMPSEIYQEFRKHMGFKHPDAMWITRKSKTKQWTKDWDGIVSNICYDKNHCKCFIKKAGTHFSTGLISRAFEFFREKDIDFSYIDNRNKIDGPNRQWIFNSDKFEERDYQEETASKSVQKERGIIKCTTGGGKCCHKDSLCITSEGIITFSEIDNEEMAMNPQSCKPLDLLVTTPLERTKIDVASSLYYDGVSSSISFETLSGSKEIGTLNHKIKVITNKGLEWKKLKDIKVGDFAVISKEEGQFGKREKLDVEDGYWLGLLTGDGSYNKIGVRSGLITSLTTQDSHIVRFAKLYCRKKKLSLKISRDKRRKKLKNLKLFNKEYRLEILEDGMHPVYSYGKEIPIEIRKSKKDVVSSYIRGLFETDGWVGKEKLKLTVSIGLSSEKLIDQLKIVLLNFGIMSRKRVKKTSRRPSYILTMYSNDVIAFSNKIGFDPTGVKYKKLIFQIEKHNLRSRNSNVDLIPFQKESLNIIKKEMKKIFGPVKWKINIEKTGVKWRTLDSWIYGKRTPSRYSLKNFCCELKNILKDLQAIDDLLFLSGDKFFFDPIIDVDKVSSDNYDFVIPNSHSFVAQGFINHNTLIAGKILAKLNIAPAIFYVPSTDLLHQIKDELERMIQENGHPIEVGLIGGGYHEIKDINVMTIQTAVRALGAKYKKFDEEDVAEKKDQDTELLREETRSLISGARVMFADEVQHWAAETCQVIADASENCQFRYGLSATPWRDRGDDMLIDACFGKTISDINATFLIEKGYLVRPEIYFIPISNMQGIEKKTYQNIYKYAVVENSLRNKWIAQISESMHKQGRNTLILCKFVEHGKILKELIPGSVFLNGSVTGDKRKAHLDKMRNREATITIATSIFDEGVDVRSLDTLILAGSGKSSTRALQRIGRVLRPYPGKKSAIIIDFEDKVKYLKDHSNKRKRIYNTEPAFIIKYLDMVA